jgi:hypothetical protein
MKKKNNRVTHYKTICLCAVWAALMPGFAAKAQTAYFSQVMNDITLVRNSFRAESGTYTSCQVMYDYSMESTPSHYLDSLSWQYKLAGSTRYTKIGNTETIQNDSAVVTLYNDDSTLMAGPVNTGIRSGEELFLNQLDSDFIAQNASSVTITSLARVKTMAFTFADSSRYYNCKLVYDSVTYIPKSISYILRSSKMSESGQPPADGAVITILFTGYSTAAFDTTALNVNRYITIGTGGKATVQAAYGTYNFIQTADFPVSGN